MDNPAGPEALTPEWLTEALRSIGTIATAAVQSIDIANRASDEYGRTKGLLGVSHQIRLTYDDDETNSRSLSISSVLPNQTQKGEDRAHLIDLLPRFEAALTDLKLAELLREEA